MSDNQYPRTVFTLTANYSVRKVTLIRPYSQTSNYGGYTAGGKFYPEREIFKSASEAIRSGRAQLKRRKKGLEAGLALVEKQAAALDKAEGK